MADLEKTFMSGIGKQLVTGLVMAIVGAGLTLVVQSGATENKIENNVQRLNQIDTRLHEIETSLANGGPQPLAQRVGSLEDRMLRMEQQVGGIYSVVVLHQSPQR